MKVHVINPSGTKTESYITDKGDGTYRVEYTAFEDGRRKYCVISSWQSEARSYRRTTAMKTSNMSLKKKKNPNLLQDRYKQTDGGIINRCLFGQRLGIKRQREK